MCAPSTGPLRDELHQFVLQTQARLAGVRQLLLEQAQPPAAKDEYPAHHPSLIRSSSCPFPSLPQAVPTQELTTQEFPTQELSTQAVAEEMATGQAAASDRVTTDALDRLAAIKRRLAQQIVNQ